MKEKIKKNNQKNKIIVFIITIIILVVVVVFLRQYLLLILSTIVFALAIYLIVYGIYGIATKNIKSLELASFSMKKLKEAESPVVFGLFYIVTGLICFALAVIGILNRVEILEFLDTLYLMIV
jgi:hypothetical protein